jgi:hypothetical protein
VNKLANIRSHLCSSPNSSLDAIFERKLIKEDGSASDEYFVNSELMAKIFFLIACYLSVSAAYGKEKKHIYQVYLNTLKAAAAAGKNRREQICDCLKHWEPEYKDHQEEAPHRAGSQWRKTCDAG